MPIYEYRCGACGHTLDALQKISDAHLADCPECKAPALKRLMSAPAFRLKGSGWYETDFKSDKEKKRNLVESKSDGGDSKSGDSSNGSKSGDKSADGATKSGGESTKSTGDGAKTSAAGKPSGGKADAPAKPAGGSEAA